MTALGFRFLDRHTLDFGVTIAPGKSINPPNKQKIKVAIPFSNSTFDFSEIYGSQTYEERQLVYPLNIYNETYRNKQAMNIRRTQVINWLMDSHGKQKLYDDAFPGYYFLAEVEGDSSFEEDYETGILTVTFTAYPFMIGEEKEGNDVWDTFNFELDTTQVTDFQVNESMQVTLYNVGARDLSPKIVTSSPMQITLRGQTFNAPAGESESHDFILKQGDNDLTITGNGTISFVFHKELI